jgi:hypothetical protein
VAVSAGGGGAVVTGVAGEQAAIKTATRVRNPNVLILLFMCSFLQKV